MAFFDQEQGRQFFDQEPEEPQEQHGGSEFGDGSYEHAKLVLSFQYVISHKVRGTARNIGYKSKNVTVLCILLTAVKMSQHRRYKSQWTQ